MTRAIRFVHAADLHLDAPFAGVEASDERVRHALVRSTYEAFDRVVDVCVERDVDFLVVAGDAFNSADRNVRAQLRFQAAAQRLAEAGVRVFVVRGNHDPASGWSAGLTMPENVHEFATDRVERVGVELQERAIGLYGRSYATSAVTENLARGFERDPRDSFAIGILHANVGGQSDYEPYAPCQVSDLRDAGMDYWALGHIHKPMLLATEPHARYAGSPQGLNPKEDGPHGCWVVTVDGDRISEEFVPTASVIWSRTQVDIRELETIEQVRAAVRDACAAARQAAAGVPVVMRVDIVGRSAAHALLGHAGVWSELVADLREEQLAETPWLFLDRVRDLTRPPIELEDLRTAQDFAGDLVRIVDELRADSAAFVDQTLTPLDTSIGRIDRDPQAVLDRALDLCLDRLLAEEDR